MTLTLFVVQCVLQQLSPVKWARTAERSFCQLTASKTHACTHCLPCCWLRQVGQDGGEDLLASWPDSVEPFSSITLAILQHLDKEGLSPQQALQLSGAAFIPVAHASRLVAPQQLFLRLGGAALAPFAWEVPGQFVAQAALLKSLGVRDEPGAEDLVRRPVWLVAVGVMPRSADAMVACLFGAT